MKKPVQRLLAIVLVSLLLLSSGPLGGFVGLDLIDFGVKAKAAGYNPSAALAYAASHWNDGVGLCAEFVSNCLKAGGVNVMQTVCDNLYNTLVNNGYGTAYTLATANSKIPMASNSGKLDPGDPVFFYCNTCKSFSHVVLCGGTDGSGYMTDYAHNKAHNNTTSYVNWACDKCKTVNWTMKSVHMVKTQVPAPVTPVFTTTQTTFTAGIVFNICWNVQNGVNYCYTLYKPSGEVVIQGECYDHITVMLAAGSYKLVVAAYNSLGEVFGEYDFTVVKMSTPTVYTNNQTYPTNSSVTVYWSTTAGAIGYYINIYKNGTHIISTDLGTNTKYTNTFGDGKYDVYVEAINSGSSSDAGYCSFTVGIYSISYNANGGSGAPSNQTKIYGTNITLSSDKPTRSGYTFSGWNTKAEGNGTAYYAPGATYTENANITLYAQWTAVTLSSITVKTNPTKTSYNVGDTLNTAGLTLTATYSDNTTQTISSGFTCSPTTLNTAGTQKITVTYQGKTATFNVTVVDNTTSAKYTVSSAKAAPGGTVVLTVSVANNPGVISLRNTVAFDGTALELIKVENLALLNGYTTPSPTMTSPYTLRWADSFATVNNTKNGALVKLTFKVKDTAQEGSYTVTAVNTEARNVNGDTVAFASGVGTVTVTNVVSGDADGDGEVTDWDAILLNRYLAGWNVTINEAACDVADNDGINDWDAIVLERYLAGWSVIFLPNDPVDPDWF